jgi:tRNA A-37 threonylcarbamoyl transferase component Bud32
LRDYVVNLSEFEERSMIGESNQVSAEIYNRFEDEFLVVVKSIPPFEYFEKSRIEQEIENLINLRHPCIGGPIGFVFPIEPDSSHGLKIIRLYCEGCSLAEVLSVRPGWWTSTVKAKVVVGIVLALRFAHSLGLVHGHLTARNILFDSDHNIQIVDFQTIFSRDRWTPKMDVDAFKSLLFEILVGRSAKDELSLPTNIPSFVSTMIKLRLDRESERGDSFNDILKILKQNNFQIEEHVDSAEVSAFVNWVESMEQSD